MTREEGPAGKEEAGKLQRRRRRACAAAAVSRQGWGQGRGVDKVEHVRHGQSKAQACEAQEGYKRLSLPGVASWGQQAPADAGCIHDVDAELPGHGGGDSCGQLRQV